MAIEQIRILSNSIQSKNSPNWENALQNRILIYLGRSLTNLCSRVSSLLFSLWLWFRVWCILLWYTMRARFICSSTVRPIPCSNTINKSMLNFILLGPLLFILGLMIFSSYSDHISCFSFPNIVTILVAIALIFVTKYYLNVDDNQLKKYKNFYILFWWAQQNNSWLWFEKPFHPSYGLCRKI